MNGLGGMLGSGSDVDFGDDNGGGTDSLIEEVKEEKATQEAAVEWIKEINYEIHE